MIYAVLNTYNFNSINVNRINRMLDFID